MNKALKIILIVLAILVGIAAVTAVGFFVLRGFGRAQVMQGYHNFPTPDGRFLGPRMMVGYSPFGFLGGIVSRLAGIALLAGLVILLVWAAGRLFGAGSPAQAQVQSAGTLGVQEILDRRYARGEISRDEYLQILKDTGRPAPDAPPAPDMPPTQNG